MATNQQKLVTRPVHTMRYFLMLGGFYLGGAVFLMCVALGNGWSVAGGMIGGFIGGISQVIMAIHGLKRGTYVTPQLSSYAGEQYRKEYRCIVGNLIRSIILSVAVVGLAVWFALSGKLMGTALIVAAVAINVYGWLALAWWQEAFHTICISQEPVATPVVPPVELPLTARIRPFTPVNTGAAGGHTVRVGTGQGTIS